MTAGHFGFCWWIRGQPRKCSLEFPLWNSRWCPVLWQGSGNLFCLGVFSTEKKWINSLPLSSHSVVYSLKALILFAFRWRHEIFSKENWSSKTDSIPWSRWYTATDPDARLQRIHAWEPSPELESDLTIGSTITFHEWLRRVRDGEFFPTFHFPSTYAGPDIVFCLRSQTIEERILCAFQVGAHQYLSPKIRLANAVQRSRPEKVLTRVVHFNNPHVRSETVVLVYETSQTGLDQRVEALAVWQDPGSVGCYQRNMHRLRVWIWLLRRRKAITESC